MLKGKYRGYDIDLYRSRDNCWIAGVCGGIAENIGWPVWLVRLAALMLFAITGSLAVMAYIAAIFLIAKRDESRTVKGSSHCRRSDRKAHTLKDTVFSYEAAPSSRIKELSKRMGKLDQRLRDMEGYVTSRKYQFDQEMKRS